ncbi:MAG: T9SS type A sorting domain-containing protein [Bacteroidetes bacterium]|nr:T9SS type A sorting domain-containing protein [Bacteroidota bacterium]
MNKFCYLITCLLALPSLVYSQPVYVNGLPVNQIPLSAPALVACNPLFSFNSPEPSVTGITHIGDSILNGGSTDAVFYLSNGNTGALVATIPKPGANLNKGGGLDYDGTYIWSVNEQEGTLYKTDALSGTVVNQWLLPNNNTVNPTDPNNFGVTYDDGLIWESEYLVPVGTGTMLHKFDASTMNLLDSFLLPNVFLAIHIIDSALWAAAFDVPYIYKIDRSTGLYLDSVPLCVSVCYGLTKNSLGFWLNGNSNFNGDKIHLYESLPTGNANINDKEEAFSIYPNPSNDAIKIEFKKRETFEYRIFDVNGMTILNGKVTGAALSSNIDIHQLKSGIFFLEITTNQSTYVKKLITY